ncbi:MAG: ABC transporter ATP-binding protein [Thermodesulfobacteriota bacterium]
MNVRIRNLGKSFPRSGGEDEAVLADINFDIAAGDFIAIVGESGCGKSTLLKLLAGLETAATGEILTEGRNRPTERIVGPHPSRSMLFQQPSLLPWLDVHDNIAFGCRLRRETADLDYQVGQFIEMMGLCGCARFFPAELSVGQAQRVCLARALIGHPVLLLMDEPFSALDTLTRTRLQEELTNIWQSEQFTAVLVTHDIEEAVLLGNRVVLLGGRPTTVRDVFDIALPYPRRITDEAFFHTKRTILARFKEVVARPKPIPMTELIENAACHEPPQLS